MEIAITGSKLYSTIKGVLPEDDLVLLGNPYSEPLIVLALSRNKCFQIRKSDTYDFEQIELNDSFPHEHYSIRELIRNFNSDISEITESFKEFDLDLARFPWFETIPDEALDMLDAFEPKGLTRLYEIAKLKLTIDRFIEITPPLTVTSSKKTTEFLFTTRVLCNNYLRLLTNALIYDLHLRVDSGVTK